MATRIPQSFIDELLARVDIVKVIDAQIKLKKSGANYSANCPFHQEKTPSFIVSPTKQIFHCFGCGKGGTAITFLMEYERLPFYEAIETLAAEVGMEIPKEHLKTIVTDEFQQLYELMKQAATFYYQQRRQSSPALDYLRQRGISDEMIKTFGIGYAPPGWDHILNLLKKKTNNQNLLSKTGLLVLNEKQHFYDRFRHRIMFPIRDKRGRIIGFGGRVINTNDQPKYLNSPETPIFHKSNALYGLYEAFQQNRQLDQLLVVEGYMDVVALAQYGISYAVATLGTATTADHIQQLFRTTSTIIFCFDGDEAGQKAAWHALEVLFPLMQDQWHPKFVFLPKDDDPDSYIRQHGKDQFETLLNNAPSFSEFFLNSLVQKIGLDSLEHRAQFAKKAMQYISSMSDGFLKEMLLDNLAQRVEMEIQKLIAMARPKQEKIEKAVSLSSLDQLIPAARIVLTLLIQNPSLVNQITVSLPKSDLPGMMLLQELIELLREHPQFTTATLLEYWRDRSELPFLTQLATQEYLLTAETLQNEFLDALQHIQTDHRDQTIDDLLRKARQQTLSEEDRARLKELLQK